jgi:hypothetical protein
MTIEDKQELQADTNRWIATEAIVRPLLDKYPDDPSFIRTVGEKLVRRVDNPADTKELYEKIREALKDWPDEEEQKWHSEYVTEKVTEVLTEIETELRPSYKSNNRSFVANLMETLKRRLGRKKVIDLYSKLQETLELIATELKTQKEAVA